MKRNKPLRARGPQRFSRTTSARDRFYGQTQQGDGCWEWNGRRVRGYGQITVNGRRVYAHRYSYELHKGPIPEGLDVMHSCDNPSCVNPEHLRPGTHALNMLDASIKGRMRGAGPSHPLYKLTAEQREDIARSSEPSTLVAARYGVTAGNIRNLRRRRKSTYRKRTRHVDYLLFVKKLACSARTLTTPCSGRIEADHVGPRGIGQKCDDRLTIPLCSQHHLERTNFSGAFKDFDQQRMRIFIAEALVNTQTAARELGVIQLAPSTP